MVTVVKLPKSTRLKRDKAEKLRQAIKDADIGLSEEAAAVVENAIYRITDTPGARAVFTMINNDQFRFVMKATQSLPLPDLTWKVFSLAVTYARQDTGEILATREKLAEDAGTLVRHISTSMSELSNIGAIIKEKRGRNVVYKINPYVAWNGGEGSVLPPPRPLPSFN